MALEHDLFGGTPRKSIKSKNKGNVNERTVCKVLEYWTGVPFKRVPGSGSLRWDDATKIAGDVTCDVADFFFPFSIETKHLSSISVKGRLNTRSIIYTIMEQCMFDADRSNRLPMMLLRPNGMPTWKDGRKQYQNYYLVLLYRFGGKFIWKEKGVTPIFIGKCQRRGFDIVGFDFKSVIETVNFKDLIEIINGRALLNTFTEKKNSWYQWSH